MKTDLELEKHDYYDQAMLALGGEDFLIKRENKLSKRTQFNLLSACGFKVPVHGTLPEVTRLQSKYRTAGIPNSSAEVVLEVEQLPLPKLCLEDGIKLNYKESQFCWIYPGIQNDLTFKRYVFIGSTIVEYSVTPKNSANQLYWMDGSCTNSSRLCEFTDLKPTNDESFAISKALNLAGQFFPCFCIEVAVLEGEEIALGLSIGPIFKGTPTETIGTPEEMAQVLLDVTSSRGGSHL